MLDDDFLILEARVAPRGVEESLRNGIRSVCSRCISVGIGVFPYLFLLYQSPPEKLMSKQHFC